jgi:hypothetical protein
MADYEPILKSFRVGQDEEEALDAIESIPDIFLYNQPVGWQLSNIVRRAGDAAVLRAPVQRYSVGETQGFVVSTPRNAWEKMKTGYPLGLRQDTLAFDMYCWDDKNADGDRYMEIRNNWMYFVSALIERVGIPLAGSGDPTVSERETVAQLMARINNHPVIGKVFYANLKYTRGDSMYPGYFEYTYMPDQHVDILKKATLDEYVLREDTGMTLYVNTETSGAKYRANSLGTAPIDTSGNIYIRSDVKAMRVAPGSGYSFSSSSVEVDDTLDTMDLSCTWTYDYAYEKEFDFVTYDTLQMLATGINDETIPQLGNDLFDANILLPGLTGMCTDLLVSSGSLGLTGASLNIAGPVPAVDINVASLSGPGYTLLGTAYSIPATQDRLILRTTIRYDGVYAPPTYSLSPGNYTLTTLSSSISALKPYVHPIFNPIFSASVYNSAYASTDSSDLYDLSPTSISPQAYPTVQVEKVYPLIGRTFEQVVASINVDTPVMGVYAVVNDPYATLGAMYTEPKAAYTDPPDPISINGTAILADFRGIVGMRTLNMDEGGVFNVLDSTIEVSSGGTYSAALPIVTADLYAWIESINGTYKSGLTKLTVHAIRVDGVPHGVPLQVSQTLSMNDPYHVFFGIMGDIKFVQISDYNLYTQLNHIQKRLGEPADNYTKIAHDGEDNEFAISKNRFLDYLRTTRYNQIKSSISNEQIPQNEYLWLYLKFHKEFGCDQRVNTLTKQIAKNDIDKSTIGKLA